MASIQEGIIRDKFNKAYNDAIAAKNYGNYALAKEKFYEAATCLDKLSLFVDEESAKKNKGFSDRLKVIANSIDPNAVTKNNVPNSTSFSSQNSTFFSATDVSSNQAEEDNATDDEMSQFFTFYSAEELTEGFESVVGLDDAKEAITEYVVNPIKYSDAYNYKFADNKAVLLEGPPGTGKTTFAKAVAKEINQPFALVNVAALVNCYVGETGKNIDKVFAYLRNYVTKNNCGLTVFFDELDEIAKSRGGDDKASASAVPALLRNMEGVKTNKNFLILANTNCMDMLDSAILDRFRKRIHIPLPDAGMRLSFFMSKLKEIEEEYKDQLDFGQMAELSEGLSGRSITYICDDFKYYLSGVKAGIKDGANLNDVMKSYIINYRR